jgi:type II secretory pathway component PulF
MPNNIIFDDESSNISIPQNEDNFETVEPEISNTNSIMTFLFSYKWIILLLIIIIICIIIYYYKFKKPSQKLSPEIIDYVSLDEYGNPIKISGLLPDLITTNHRLVSILTNINMKNNNNNDDNADNNLNNTEEINNELLKIQANEGSHISQHNLTKTEITDINKILT